MRYLSICTGIGSETVAWHPLGWECVAFAEIEPQACSVLSQRWPDIPNVGDFRDIKGEEFGPIDLVFGGTPCQPFSIAGLRRGLDDDRGNLTLEYCRLLDRIRPEWMAWENVPGVHSSVAHQSPDPSPETFRVENCEVSEDGSEFVYTDEYDADEAHAFSSFVAALQELGYCLAWKIYDAEYVRVESHPRAVPQRRRRVFVVGHLGDDWRPPVAVLLEPEGLRGDSPPRRRARKDVAGTLTSHSRESGGGGPDLGTDFYLDGGLTPLYPEVSGTITARMGKAGVNEGELETLVYGGGNTSGELDVAPSLLTSGQHQDFDTEPLVAAPLTKDVYADRAGEESLLVSHPLTAEGCDASEDGTGRGQRIIPFDTTQITHPVNASNPQPGDPSPTLSKTGHPPVVAFDSRQDPCVYGDATGALNSETPQSQAVAIPIDLRQTRRGEKNTNERESGGAPGTGVGEDGDPAYAVTSNGQAVAIQERMETQPAENSQNGKGWKDDGSAFAMESRTKPQSIADGMMVRRITPLEAERLMGYRDGYTAVEYRGKPMADDPRYRLLGNSICINVLEYIGERIAMFRRVVQGLT